MGYNAIRLDNPVFTGRLKAPRSAPAYQSRSIVLVPRLLQDVKVASMPATTTPQQAKPSQAQPLDRAYKPALTAIQPPAAAVTVKNQGMGTKKLEYSYSAKPAKRIYLSHKLLTAMAIVIFIAGVAVSVWGLRTNQQVIEQVQAANSEDSGNLGRLADVDETEPNSTAVRSHSVVSPDYPRHLYIDKIGVYARVKPQGLGSHGEVGAPKNIHDIGWYKESSTPGEGGAVLLTGHLSGITKNGVFYNLKKLTVGDLITVTRGDGREVRYRVVQNETYRLDELNTNRLLLSVDPGRQGLNLITCAGRYDVNIDTYDKRRVVYAVLE